ncbi:hypothetical protein [Pontibacter rugosus]
MINLYLILLSLWTGAAEAPASIAFAPVALPAISNLHIQQTDTAKATAEKTTQKKRKHKKVNKERAPAAARVTMKRNVSKTILSKKQ